MNTITRSQHYPPHKITTKYHAVKLYRSSVGVAFVYRRYKISLSFDTPSYFSYRARIKMIYFYFSVCTNQDSPHKKSFNTTPKLFGASIFISCPAFRITSNAALGFNALSRPYSESLLYCYNKKCISAQSIISTDTHFLVG